MAALEAGQQLPSSAKTELYVGATCSYLRGCENACNVHPATA